MRCIHAFTIQPGPFILTLPKGSKVFDVAIRATSTPQPPWRLSHVPVVHIGVDTEAARVDRRFITVLLDDELPDAFANFGFVGSFTIGNLTALLFDAGEDDAGEVKNV